jgi:integrase
MKDFMSKSKKMVNFLELHVSKASRRHYEYHLQEFFIWKKETHIDDYIKDPRRMNTNKRITYEDNLKNDILRYWKYINEESGRFHGKTAYPFLSAMKGFLETKEIVFPQEFWRNLRRNGTGNYAITNFQTPTKEQLKAILSNADVQSKALFIAQMTAGQRKEQVLKLSWSDIQLEHDYPRVFIRKQKSKRAVKTRITPEAKEYLIEYKKQSNRILTTREQRTPHSVKKPLDKNLVFPMSKGSVDTMWNNLTKKAGLYQLDPITHKPLMGTHCLRRYFQTHFGNENDALFFMGKTPENIATYYRMNDEELDLKYIKGAENLTIFKEKSDTPAYLKQQDVKMDEIREDLETSNKYNDMLSVRVKSQDENLKSQGN